MKGHWQGDPECPRNPNKSKSSHVATASSNSAFVGSESTAYCGSSQVEDSADLDKVETVVDPPMGVLSSKSDEAVADSGGRDLQTGTENIRRVSAFLSLQDDSDCESTAMVASGVSKTSLKKSRSASRERKGADDVEIMRESIQLDTSDSFEEVPTPRTVTFAPPASEGVFPSIAARIERGRQANRRSDPDVTHIIEEALKTDEQDSIGRKVTRRSRKAQQEQPPQECVPCEDGCKRTTTRGSNETGSETLLRH